MNDEPAIPQPPPVIPRRALWLILAAPPLVTVLATVFIPFCFPNQDDAVWMLVLVPVVVSLGLIPGLAFHFHDAVRHRYRGISLWFLVFSYMIGEIIGCIVLSVGSCLLVSVHLINK